jgi:mannose-6-phosphate isomerase-like protein (cupin superfamily)
VHEIALPALPDVTAPDGSHVRILCALDRGSMAHFTLAPGMVSKAVRHRTVEEIWYILAGSGKMWRANSAGESVTDLEPGLSLTIPAGTSFQFRSDGTKDLEAVAITMPPWPGMDEAEFVNGMW